MWIFAQSRPYYPSIEEFGTREEAEREMESFLADEGSSDGEHETVVYVAEVSTTTAIRTHY